MMGFLIYMAKNFPYFKFTSSEWLTGDIVFEDLETQGLFINICAIYWQRDGELLIEDIQKRFEKSLGKSKLSECLAKLSDRFLSVNDENNGLIAIKFLDEQLVSVWETSHKNSLNGAKGGQSNAKRIKDLKANSSDRLANSSEEKQKREEEEKKRKELEKRKEEEKKKFTPPTIFEVIQYFKEKDFSEDLGKRAFEFYDTANWIDSKGNKVKNWKQKMLSVWLKPENKETPQSTSRTRKPYIPDEPRRSNKPATVEQIINHFANQPQVSIKLGDYQHLIKKEDTGNPEQQ